MKKSLLTLLTAILIGSSFTSCVENTIPDEVVAIYDGQANLLAAQAALLAAEANAANAEAAMSAAMVAFQQSQTEAQNVANDYAQANNAILLAQAQASLSAQIALDAAVIAEMEANLAIMIAAADTSNAAAIARLEAELAEAAVALALEQAVLDNMVAENATAQAVAQARLEAILAQAVIDAATAQNELEIAQANHTINLEALANQLAQLDDDKIAEYFRLYTSYSNALGLNRKAEVEAQLDVIKQIADIAFAAQDDAQMIAGFNNDILFAQSQKVDLEAQKATLEAAIAVGTSLGDNNAKAVLLQEEIDALATQITDLDLALGEMDLNIMRLNVALEDLEEELGLDQLSFEFGTTKDRLNVALGDKAMKVAINVELELAIKAATDAIANYAATTATLKEAVASTTTAADAAGALVDPATVAASNALSDFITQNIRLETLVEAVAFAKGTVQDTAIAWDDALFIKANSTTQARVDAAIEGKINAQAAYDIAKANFLDQEFQTTWGPGPDNRLGIQSDDSIDAVATYEFITSISTSSDGETTTYTATFGEATTTFPTPEEEEDPEVNTAGKNGDEPKEIDPNDINAETNVGDYTEFGADDVPTNDLEEFNSATDVLQLANVELDEANEANVDVDIAVAEAKADFDEATNIFENATTLVEVQTEVTNVAEDLRDSTNIALLAAIKVAVVAESDAIDAEFALEVHEAFTVAMYETVKEDNEVNVLQNNINITIIDVSIAEIEAELAVILAKLEAGVPAEFTELEAELKDAQIEFDAELVELEALYFSRFIKQQTVNMIGMEYAVVLDIIAGIDEDIAIAVAQIATAEANIIAFPGLAIEERDLISATELAQLEAVLADLQADVVLYAALSAKYKALIDSLL